MTSRVPDQVGLRLLVAVARAGSIGGAARDLGVTQQSASERLRAVEAQVGVTLVARGPRGSSLTPAGVVVTEWAADLLHRIDEVEVALDGLRAERDRSLAVWASMTVAESLVPRWLVQLRARQAAAVVDPGAEAGAGVGVSLTAANSAAVLDAVRDGVAALGFVEGVDAPIGLRSVEVADDELVLVVAAGSGSTVGSAARRRRTLGPAEVAALALTGREPGSGTREVVERALAVHGLRPAVASVELTTGTAVREAVLAGGAPAFLSRRVVARELEAGRLVEVAVEGLDLTRRFRAVWVGTARPPAGAVRDLVAIARGAGR